MFSRENKFCLVPGHRDISLENLLLKAGTIRRTFSISILYVLETRLCCSCKACGFWQCGAKFRAQSPEFNALPFALQMRKQLLKRPLLNWTRTAILSHGPTLRWMYFCALAARHEMSVMGTAMCRLERTPIEHQSALYHVAQELRQDAWQCSTADFAESNH